MTNTLEQVPNHYNSNISGIDKAELLAALYNGTKALGMGKHHDLGRDMTVEEAQTVIDSCKGVLFFDYLYGRPIKTDIRFDKTNFRLYDRDTHPGAGDEIVARLRGQS